MLLDDMAKYYVGNEPEPNGDHAVHVEGCVHLPADRQYVGDYDDCYQALKAAQKHYIWANGCAWCLRLCHYS